MKIANNTKAILKSLDDGKEEIAAALLASDFGNLQSECEIAK